MADLIQRPTPFNYRVHHCRYQEENMWGLISPHLLYVIPQIASVAYFHVVPANLVYRVRVLCLSSLLHFKLLAQTSIPPMRLVNFSIPCLDGRRESCCSQSSSLNRWKMMLLQAQGPSTRILRAMANSNSMTLSR